MVKDSSASVRVEKPHETETTQITINDALRRRAQAAINDRSIDPQWRNIIRYALQINDPFLPDLVRRADAGERIIDTTDTSERFETNEDHSTRKKIEALAEIICGAGAFASASGSGIWRVGSRQAHTIHINLLSKHLDMDGLSYGSWVGK